MRIAQVAPLTETVPPTGYGGTELVVSLLTEQLVENGHEVTLFASGDSTTNANLVSVTSASLRNRDLVPIHRWPAYDIRSLLKVKEMQSEFDIIHNHMGYQALPFLDTLKCPVVTTNHNLVADYCSEIYLAYKQMPYVAISEAYKRLNYPDILNYARVIYNGIDVDQFMYRNGHEKRDYLLFLGRVSADKGTAVAIDIAVKLGLPLKVVGKVDVTDQSYFDKEIKPRLDNPLIEFVGEADFAAKTELYSKAIAVIYPIAFAEPFGLVMAEALASGTPVAALDRGSVKEVISDGETGIVASTPDEIVKRFGEVEKISHADCRKRASELFSKERMAMQYEELYRSLIA